MLQKNNVPSCNTLMLATGHSMYILCVNVGHIGN